jgi:hypothetical protein
MIKLGRLFASTLSCSFCGKSERDVSKLIAGPSVFICDECVTICVGILQNGGPLSPPAPHGVQRRRLLDRVRDWFACAVKDPVACTFSRFSR